MNPTADRSVVLAVVLGLVAFALLALALAAWLIHDQVDPVAVALLTTPMGVALGALGALLASTRTTTAATAQAEATGYEKAIATVKALPTAPAVPVDVVNDADQPVPVDDTPTPPPARPRKAAR